MHDEATARAIARAIEHVGDDGARAPAIGLDEPRAAVGVHVGAGGDGVGYVGHERRLLGVERTAEAAEAEARAALDAAADELGTPTELRGAVPELAVVAVDVVAVAGADREALLDGREVRRQRRRVEAAHAVALGPQAQRRLGRAERRRPVHRRAAAHGAALQDHDREIVGGAVAVLLIERGIGPRLLHVEVPLRVVRALFDDGDVRAGLRERRGRDAAAGAAADDDKVHLDRVKRWERGARRDAAGAGRGARGVRHAGPRGTSGGPA